MKRPKQTQRNQWGFTIVELMIATMVFSTILLVITIGVMSFTHSYYKGVNSSTTQGVARNAIDTIANAIQLSGTSVVGTDGHPSDPHSYFCAGGNVYIFIPGVQYLGDPASSTNPGLYSVPESNGCSVPASSPFTGGSQLLAKHMRIASLTVTPATDATQAYTYTIAIRLAYSSGGVVGHDGEDLLCSPSLGTSQPGSCTDSTGNLPSFAVPDLTCKSQTGSQFCAISALSTTVVQRVANSGLSD